MAAPILEVKTSDPNGNIPYLTLDQNQLVPGFWAAQSNLPTSVQIYASGATPGLLQPGERIRVPVYYAGLQRFNTFLVRLGIFIHSAGSTDLIDWNALKPTLKPSWLPADAWDGAFANVQAQIGSTWGDYIGMLSDNARYLGQLGLKVTDVNQLYGFELQQALGLTPVPTLASAEDANLPSPGLTLNFGRSFGNNIADRYALSGFGRGWTAPWQTFLETQADGTVVVHESGNSLRFFTTDRRQTGAYFSQQGDTGVLKRLTGGAYTLTETSGLVTRFQSDGKLDYLQDINGNRITASFTSGKLSGLTHSSGAHINLAYNGDGLITSLTAYISAADMIGRTTTYNYDLANKLLLSATGPGGTTSYSYITGSNPAAKYALLSVTDPSGVIRHFDYDNRGRLTSTYLGSNIEPVTYGYDSAGGVTVTDAMATGGKLFFDHRGLILRTEDSLGNYALHQYNDARQLVKTTDTLGRWVSYIRCDCGRPTSITDQLGHTSTFTLGGPNNNPTAFTDANGNVTRYSYDAQGNLSATTYPDGSVERITHDALGNPTTLTNRRGQAVNLAHNAAGQVTLETFPDASTNAYTYDNRARLATATDSHGTTSFTYDPSDRLTRVDYPQGRWLSYTYDAAGRRTRMEDNSGFVVHYFYDTVGRLIELKDGTNASLVIYTYDAAGRLQREDKGNSTYTLYTYDGAGRVLSIFNHAPDDSVNSRFIYTYDAVGQRTSMETSDGTWTYTYDLKGQLTRAVFASTNVNIPNQDLNYVYDPLGNRIRTVLNGVTTNYTTNNLNEYTQVGATTNSFDLDGNLVQEAGPGGTRQYTYDALNRLTRLVTPQGTWDYEYDALGNRVASELNGQRTEYLLDPTGIVNVFGQYDDNGNRTLSHVFGFGLTVSLQSGAWNYYDFDGLGSVAALTDTTGTNINSYSYDPFGATLAITENTANIFQFAGSFGVTVEDNGTVYMRSRFYSYDAGRFLSQDWVGLEGGVNLYAYVDNRSPNAVDPIGFRGKEIPTKDLSIDGVKLNGMYQFETGDIYYDPDTGHTASILVHERTHKFLHEKFGITSCIVSEAAAAGAGGISAAFEADWDYVKHSLARIWELRSYCNSGNDHHDVMPPDVPGGTPGGSGSAVTSVPRDPNAKFGATGFGPAAFIPVDTTIPYRIEFENVGPGSDPVPDIPATAPAQRVEVTDQLTNHLDWSTFAFTETGFGDTVISVPPGLQYYFTSVFRTYNEQTFLVEVELSFDAAFGQVRAVFQSIEPGTFLPPDVLTGFLPPEDGTGRGKGHIGYTIRPRQDRPSGTQLRNIALITFDGQGTIATNQIDPDDPGQGIDPNKEALNTIDAQTPSSNVAGLPATTPTTSFTVNWLGQDEAGGSGIGTYSVFVSDNGGTFTPWLTDVPATSSTYNGVNGHTYSFYSVATDNVGHVEAVPLAPDTTTLVAIPVTINSVTINGNISNLAGAQRSRVNSIVYVFNQQVSLAAGAFTIAIHSGSTGMLPTLNWTTIDSGTTWIVTFSGNGVVGGSIADGRYDLTLHSAAVSTVPGGTLASDRTDEFFRLYGDINGDARVDFFDFFQFRAALGSQQGETNYRAAFDYNGDGLVDFLDFFRFRSRLGTSI